MTYQLRVQAKALRQAAADSQTDPLLVNMMLETAGELEALADQVEAGDMTEQSAVEDGPLSNEPAPGSPRQSDRQIENT